MPATSAQPARRIPSPAGELVEANARLERRVAELLAVQELAQSFAGEMHLGALLEVALTTLSSLTGAHAVSILLLEPGQTHLVVGARRGGAGCRVTSSFGTSRQVRNEDVTPGERRRVGEGLAGWVAEHQVPLLLPDVEAEPRFREAARVEGRESGSFVGVPMVVRERLVGVVCAAEKAGGLEFDERDLRILICLAPHLAIAIRNATLYAELGDQVRTRLGEPVGQAQ